MTVAAGPVAAPVGEVAAGLAVGVAERRVRHRSLGLDQDNVRPRPEAEPALFHKAVEARAELRASIDRAEVVGPVAILVHAPAPVDVPAEVVTDAKPLPACPVASAIGPEVIALELSTDPER
jgi:hypothetical protein